MTRAATSKAPRPLTRRTASAERPAGVARAAMGSESMAEITTPRPDGAYAFFRFLAGGRSAGGRSVFTSTITLAVRFMRSRPSSHCCGMLAMLLTV